MSRIAKAPIAIPKGVDLSLAATAVTAKGGKGSMTLQLHPDVTVSQDDGVLSIAPRSRSRRAIAMAGTTRALLNNIVTGVSEGFERKLSLIGVGYRAQAQGQNLNLTLGFSHPVVYKVRDGVTVETPSNTEIIVRGVDKQAVGQVAAEIRAYRPPEPYKGKGVRYADEHVIIKEAKKK